MKTLGIALLAAAAFVCACSGGSSPTSTGDVDSCPSAPKTCPSDAPGYAAVVSPIFAKACTPCHSPTGDAGDRLLTNLAQIQHYAGPSLTQTAACQMPPDGTPMAAQDRADMLAWLVCGALDN